MQGRTAVRRGILSAVLLSSLSWWLFSEWPTLALSFAATVEEATEEPLRTVYPLLLGGALLGLFSRIRAERLGLSAEPRSLRAHWDWRTLHLSCSLCDSPSNRTKPDREVHARARYCRVEASRKSHGVLFTCGAPSLDWVGSCTRRGLRSASRSFRAHEARRSPSLQALMKTHSSRGHVRFLRYSGLWKQHDFR